MKRDSIETVPLPAPKIRPKLGEVALIIAGDTIYVRWQVADDDRDDCLFADWLADCAPLAVYSDRHLRWELDRRHLDHVLSWAEAWFTDSAIMLTEMPSDDEDGDEAAS